jgi:hypothetical protein
MNVQEILNISKQRKQKTKEIIHKVVENIHKKIKYYAQLKKENCLYMIPPILNDTPVYELEIVIKDVFKILDSEGYIVTAYPNGHIHICWNEKLVQQKVKTDAYVLTAEERKLKNITKKAKEVDERFSFLANPEKTTKPEHQSIDQKLDEQLEKILKQKDHQQKKYKHIIGTFNKVS